MPRRLQGRILPPQRSTRLRRLVIVGSRHSFQVLSLILRSYVCSIQRSAPKGPTFLCSSARCALSKTSFFYFRAYPRPSTLAECALRAPYILLGCSFQPATCPPAAIVTGNLRPFFCACTLQGARLRAKRKTQPQKALRARVVRPPPTLARTLMDRIRGKRNTNACLGASPGPYGTWKFECAARILKNNNVKSNANVGGLRPTYFGLPRRSLYTFTQREPLVLCQIWTKNCKGKLYMAFI